MVTRSQVFLRKLLLLIALLPSFGDSEMDCCCAVVVIFTAIEVELDARSIVVVLGNSSYTNDVVFPILGDCRQLVSQFHQNRIKYCFCEANRCGESLARMRSNQHLDFILYAGQEQRETLTLGNTPTQYIYIHTRSTQHIRALIAEKG